jgi:Nickel responsive protein SCO4226-like
MDGEAEYLAECFWPGVREAELRALDERARASAAGISAQGRPVCYLGSLLMRKDEVVLCLFAGSPDAVREAAEQAEMPFDRIVETDRSPWAVAETE